MLFQSTHPHGVRRTLMMCGRWRMQVSIHAPTRGATCRGYPRGPPTAVSIHAPTRGATRAIVEKLEREEVSIHAPTRGATVTQEYFVGREWVSIHAPTRGATNGGRPKAVIFLFQSTHPHGVRLQAVIEFLENHKFQSTHPHGVRPVIFFLS